MLAACLHQLLSASAAGALVAPANSTLYNGIVLPAQWPPRHNLTNRTSLSAPWYTLPARHPEAVVIDVGRQLFVDDGFLLDPGSNVTTEFHAPTLHEAAPGTHVGGGGLWWDASANHFKNFFTCTKAFHIQGDGALGPLCLATSEDGVTWRNHTTGTAPFPNMVWSRPAFSRAVLLDELAADPSQRWKLVQVEYKGPSHLQYQLYASSDGLDWSRQSANHGTDGGIGAPGDCSSAMLNPFRNVTILSAKYTDSLLGRQRLYAEANVFSEEAFPEQREGFVPWAAADADDPRWLGGPRSFWAPGGNVLLNSTVPELYNLDGIAYESVMIGFFRIFRCKERYPGCTMMYKKPECLSHPTAAGCEALAHELADMLLGFSRDGFTWSRTHVAQPHAAAGFDLTPDRRYPFVGQELGSKGWNSHGIGSIQGGGLTISGDDKQHESLRLFFSSADRVGTATLRRDGFASVGSAKATLGAMLLTVPLMFNDINQSTLFLNVKGGVQSLLLIPSAGDGLPLLSMDPSPGLPAQTDSTMLPVALRPGTVPDLAALRGNPFRLSMVLEPGARLYAFWVSSAGGHSGGWLGAGGPRYPRGLQDRGEH